MNGSIVLPYQIDDFI